MTRSGVSSIQLLGHLGAAGRCRNSDASLVVFDNPVTAVAATLAVYLTLYIVGRIEFFAT